MQAVLKVPAPVQCPEEAVSTVLFQPGMGVSLFQAVAGPGHPSACELVLTTPNPLSSSPPLPSLMDSPSLL